MKKVVQPKKPVPPARDTSLPRPHFDLDTSVLMQRAKVLSATIKQQQAETMKLIDERVEILLELERRDVSYRAMGRQIDMSAPSIIAILKRRRKSEPIA